MPTVNAMLSPLPMSTTQLHAAVPTLESPSSSAIGTLSQRVALVARLKKRTTALRISPAVGSPGAVVVTAVMSWMVARRGTVAWPEDADVVQTSIAPVYVARASSGLT